MDIYVILEIILNILMIGVLLPVIMSAGKLMTTRKNSLLPVWYGGLPSVSLYRICLAAFQC